MGSVCCPDAHLEPITPPEDGAEQKDFIDDLIENAVVLPPKPAEALAKGPSLDEIEAALSKAVLGTDWNLRGQRFLAKVVSVYDGDTLRIVIHYGGRLTQFNSRMDGYDSPEMKPPKSDPLRVKTKQAAEKVRKALLARVERDLVFVECGDFDKYGRLLVVMHTRGEGSRRAENGENLNKWMTSKGYGLPYDGGKKTVFTEEHLDRIIMGA